MQQEAKPPPGPMLQLQPAAGGDIQKVIEEKPVVVVGRRGCCMAHVARRLLLGQGANPVVFEVGDEADPAAVMEALQREGKGRGGGDGGGATRHAAFPAVFVGGKLVGGVDRLMAVHIAGELVPILKQAGALWL